VKLTKLKYHCKFEYILTIHLVVLSVVGLFSSVQAASLQKYGHNETILGNGAGGTVYLYRNEANSTLYAVKKFERNIWDEPEAEYMGRIKSEYYIAASLTHDHIIKTLDLVHLEENDAWFQVMEYCPCSLWDKAIRTEAGIPAVHAMCVFRQILDAVSYMHAEGIAHHDLKLSNVMLDFNGNAKIIDFGTSYWLRGLDQNVIEMRWGTCSLIEDIILFALDLRCPFHSL
jgi:serine/threonine protein kinase